MIHPMQAQSFQQFVDRADIGPVPGIIVLLIGVIYCGTLAALAIWVSLTDRKKVRLRGEKGGQMG